MTSSLPISDLIIGQIILTPTGAQAQNTSVLLILGSSTVIDTRERYRVYANLAAVATDFGTTAPEYLAAALWFEQTPQPAQVWVGRWAQTATSAVLRGAALSSAQQTISNWTTITAGSFQITIDGTVKSITGLNFSAATNLNGVAADITVALANAATVVWNSSYSRFELTDATTGATSTLTFASSTGSGTDISTMLGWTATSSGAYVVDGIVAETALSAVTLFDSNYGQNWYAVSVCGITDTDAINVAGYIETSGHIYGVTTQEAAALTSGDTTNIGYKLKALGYNRTFVQYSSSSPYAICSYLSRLINVDYNGNNTVITMMYKQEPGIVAETLNSTQLANVLSYNINVFVAYNNNTAIVRNGVAASGIFSDIITDIDWLFFQIQTALYNALYTSPTKVPQTDAGQNILLSICEGYLADAVTNGTLAPGVWTSAGFGALNTSDFMAKGYYAYSAPFATQSTTARAARKAMPIQIAAKLAGAVHGISYQIYVNQ